MDLQRATTELLGQLVRLNTVNPPGAERPAQELLAGLLREAGFEVELLGRTEPRPNLVARLRGHAPGPTLGLLSHIDTVLATPEEWSHGPWSGEVADGYLWGRGALDMKSQTAAEVTAAVSLAREGWRPAHGDLLVLVMVDEETGGGEGARWLTQTHPDKVRCDFLINEGAGALIPFDGRRLYGVSVAEKGVFRFTITTEGVAAHASMPRLGDNALLKMAPLLARLRDHGPTFDLTEPSRAVLRGLGLSVDGDGDPAAALQQLRARDASLADLVEPMLGVTFAATQIKASDKINVIPSRAELRVDCRTPPGLGEPHALARVREILGDDGYEIAFNERVIGNASPPQSPLMDAIKGWVARQDPDASVVPYMIPAFTDSTTFRAAFPDTIAYGFFPHRHMTLYETMPLLHAKDERVDVRDLGFAATFFRDVTKELLDD